MRRRWVSLFVTPSQFARRKLVEGGIPDDRVVVKPNFVDLDLGAGEGEDNFMLFVGRLTPEKGIRTLLEAHRRLHSSLPLQIVGDGPLRSEVEHRAAISPEISWRGQLPRRQVIELMRGATLTVVPSEGYETFGRVVAESFACGTPVLASDLGALAELVDEGRTGLRFHAGDVEDLADRLSWVVEHRATIGRMRREARAEFEARFTPGRNYDMLMSIYETAMARV
jgi:glycosyltransferase involved in cell wall biosynthesis